MRAFLISCFLLLVQLHSVNAQRKSKKSTTEDTIVYVVLQLDQIKGASIDTNYRPATLSPAEITELERILEKCVADHNKSLPKDSYAHIDLTLHKRQYIPSINKNGDKQVWVNCFCFPLGTDWKNTIVFVNDGGSCFFNVVVNLSQKKCLRLEVNGVG